MDAPGLTLDPFQRVFIRRNRTGLSDEFYAPQRAVSKHLHHYLREAESGVLNAQAVVRIALELKKSGFVPDVMLGHNGWGEIWYLKEVFTQTPLIGYFEFFYHLHGADVGFDPADRAMFDTGPRIRPAGRGEKILPPERDALTASIFRRNPKPQIPKTHETQVIIVPLPR